jgi:hypothetical protein
MFEMYYARLMGIAHCIVPQLLPLADPQSSLMQAPSMELLASIMAPNQQLPLGGSQMPSIVQIIVPAHSLPQHIHILDKLNITEDTTTAQTTTTTMEPTTTTTTILPETFSEDPANDTTSTTEPIESSSTVEPLRSSEAVTLPSSTQEPEKEEDMDDIDIDVGDDYDDEKVKKQRDRSDFRYVESFESEKSIAQKFDPDPNDNETELKNDINENNQQIPSVLPIPNALSSSKDTENEDHEPPEELQDSMPEEN